jgi:putative hydrolase of the HAD superfamily
MLRAVLFDVDFTLAKPGPDLGPEGYERLGRRFGLALDSARYDEARRAAVERLERHPELDHDEQVWVLFTEQIIRGMGGSSDRVSECAVEMTRAWEHAHNFAIYDDVLPTLQLLRERRLGIGLVSNTSRDLQAFVRHHGLEVDAAVGSGLYGKTKPHPTIFRHVLEQLDVVPEDAVMVGDSVEDDVEGARAVGMRAFLIDREGRFPERDDKLDDLRALPAALGLDGSIGAHGSSG